MRVDTNYQYTSSGVILQDNDDEYIKFQNERQRAIETNRLREDINILAERVKMLEDIVERLLNG